MSINCFGYPRRSTTDADIILIDMKVFTKWPMPACAKNLTIWPRKSLFQIAPDLLLGAEHGVRKIRVPLKALSEFPAVHITADGL